MSDAKSTSGKKIPELTDEELISEYNYWINKLTSAKSWGASLAAASEFSKSCARELRSRNIDPITLETIKQEASQ